MATICDSLEDMTIESMVCPLLQQTFSVYDTSFRCKASSTSVRSFFRISAKLLPHQCKASFTPVRSFFHISAKLLPHQCETSSTSVRFPANTLIIPRQRFYFTLEISPCFQSIMLVTQSIDTSSINTKCRRHSHTRQFLISSKLKEVNCCSALKYSRKLKAMVRMRHLVAAYQ